MSMVGRRAFVGSSLAAAGLALSACGANQQAAGGASSAAQTVPETSSSDAPSLLQTFDMHADTIDALGMVSHQPYADFHDKFSGTLASNNGQVSADRMKGTRWVQCYAIWLPDANGEGEERTDLSHIAWYREAVQWFKGQMETYANIFTQVRRFSDIPSILDEGKIAAILTVENAACLNEGLQVVDEFAADGVMIAGLTWNGRNVLGSGNDHPEEGLTSLGKEYVASLEQHGIVLDVSHLNEKGFWDVESVATKPYVATHSNARAVCNHLRNLTDEQFGALVKRGGVVGLNLNDSFVRDGGYVYTFDELAAHVEKWIELGGENAIALGTDRDGAEIPTWLADCSSQSYLFERFCERLGESVARKLFFENAMSFFSALP